MRLIDLLEGEKVRHADNSYDVDLDVDDDRLHMEVTMNGMPVAELTYEDGEIVWIHVEPFFRKQGLGSFMVKYLQDKGYSVVMPDARTDDGKAFFGKLDQKGKLDEAKKPWLRVTNQMIQQAVGNKCQVIVEMPATEFIAMTTSSQEQQEIIKQASKGIRDYNRWAKAGDNDDYRDRINQGKTRDDRDYQWGTIIMPFLIISAADEKLGVVKSHEGRHRSAASLRDGNGMVQVALCLDPAKDHPAFVDSNVWDSRYHATSEHIPAYVRGQFDGKTHSTKNWKVIKDDLQKNTRR